MSKKFCIRLEGEVELSVEDVWPDGDAPENPTADDVLEVLNAGGGVYRVMLDWSMDDAFEWSVS